MCNDANEKNLNLVIYGALRSILIKHKKEIVRDVKYIHM